MYEGKTLSERKLSLGLLLEKSSQPQVLGDCPVAHGLEVSLPSELQPHKTLILFSRAIRFVSSSQRDKGLT